VIGNVGMNLINTLTIDVFVDSVFHSSIQWNNALPSNFNTNSTPFPITFEDNSINGSLIEFIVYTPNDANPTNNYASHNLNDGLITPNTEFTLQIKMDNYPADIYWALTNSTDDVLTEGVGADYAAFEEIEITTVLDSNDCYTFTIMDSYGDGLCCAFGEGYFNILSDQDTLITGINFEDYFIESFYVGNEIGVEEIYSGNKRIVNKLYFNLIGEEISYPTQIGIYIQKTIFDDGTFDSKKMILSNTKL